MALLLFHRHDELSYSILPVRRPIPPKRPSIRLRPLDQEAPKFIYGLPYRLEPKEFGQIGDPYQVYVLANPLLIKPLLDRASPGRKRLLVNVFLARLEEWGWFGKLRK
ncbi:hypothetical protein HMF3257_34590 [Spirosoma telluris]|uniref:Uncharacterized protein n=1 Tax=Spirosoma telluris TaxID=2183553 RepID=A0A327NYJ6_9BACT|nr:hypothetical protein HMF3257_34590 [Spirosoma telluris]